MKLAMRLCSSSHPRASICLVNGGPRPSFASKSTSECGFCRTVFRIKVSSSRTSSTLVVAPSISSPLIARFPIAASTNPTRSDAPQRSEEWFALRRDKLTTSTFGTALGFWKGNRRPDLWSEKVFSPDPNADDSDDRNRNPGKYSAMEWGVSNEALAIGRYEGITGREVGSLGFAVHAEERLGWLGASPDGILSCFELGDGILEVKCPYNKGKPEKGLPWSKVPFYYVPQVQGQMEVMDREWLDLYCWTPNGSSVFRVNRDRAYWDLIQGLLREFWWDHVVPAREAFALGRDEKDIRSLYQPASTHKLTGLVIFKSAELAEKAKLFCREIAGHVEYF